MSDDNYNYNPYLNRSRPCCTSCRGPRACAPLLGETLGFAIEETPESSQFLVHAGGDTRILVYERARTVAEHTAAELIVDDLRATVEELRSPHRLRGYYLPGLKTVDGIVDMGGQVAAWFTDPEGNIISVAEME